MAGASIINVAVLHSAAVVPTVLLCVLFALIARSRLASRRIAAAHRD